MNTAKALDQLHEHQQAILGHLAQAVLLVEQGGGVQVPIAKARWEMMRLLRLYQLFKHGEIFDPALAHGNGEQRALAERLKSACIAIGKEYEAHTRLWSGEDVASKWDAYVPAMHAMAQRLRAHIASERRLVAVLLDGSERTRRLR